MANSQILLYHTEDGQTKIDVRLQDETVWLSQAQMGELFQKERPVITKHIKNIFEEGELEEELVCANFAHTNQHEVCSRLIPLKKFRPCCAGTLQIYGN
ncbi:hypothetical protein [Gaoshiqia sp. Z1-71]|uniref:hypothetical protein n=1 Tax=Gaoshiqia hydrogeniformans TaxID=3290090 RepID=UPI003BF7BBD8